MKKLNAKDAAAARKRFKEAGEAYRRAKLELVRAVHEVESNNRFPEYLWPDMNDDAWFHRKSAASELIEKRGGFSNHVSMLALVDSDRETKEAVAAWLRRELRVLREAEGRSGEAPVRRNAALSRTVISDVAIELLECIGGESLICLFQELLDVDRHRKSLAESFVQLDRAAEMEAQLQLQGRHIGVRELAGHMSVSPSSVTRWRKNSAYRRRLDFHKEIWGTSCGMNTSIRSKMRSPHSLNPSASAELSLFMPRASLLGEGGAPRLRRVARLQPRIRQNRVENPIQNEGGNGAHNR
jgi:hypothetical protein